MISEKELDQIASRYFSAWNKHDLKALKNLFSEEIQLTDWDISCKGIDQTVEANRKIFANNPNISASVKSLTFAKNKIYAELVIDANNELLTVLDILTIDLETKLISKLEAFRQ